MSEPGLDGIGWFIATSHQLLGHDKAAVIIGQPASDKAACLICQYERDPSPEGRQAVIRALGPEVPACGFACDPDCPRCHGYQVRL